MMNDTSYGDREIADLLPWYETGRLSPAERARVDAALAQDPALRRELDLVREELAATVAANEALGAPSRQATDRFFAALDAEAPARRGFSLTRFVADRLEALRPQTLAWGAMAALALVALQAGIITHLASQGGGTGGTNTYESASVKPPAAPLARRAAPLPTLLVAFAPAAPASAVQDLLQENHLVVVAGPNAGFFTVRVEGPGDAAKVEELMARLKAHKNVVRLVMRQAEPD